MQVRNEKARRFLMNMRRKPGVKFEQYFHKADRGALRLLKLMLSFDPAERPTSDEVFPTTIWSLVRKHDCETSHIFPRFCLYPSYRFL